MTSWRIVQAGHTSSAFDGEGARRYPGRWNNRGTPLVYTAASPSLAAMELLVHLETPDILRKYIVIPVTFDMRYCRMIDVSGLPKDWTSDACMGLTRNIGAGWCSGNESLVLGVPSAVVPLEFNYLINPRHPDFIRLKIGHAREFRYDSRVLKTPDTP